MAQYTKKAIADCFVALLNERPFDKISVVDIADRCGITRNTFYYYYNDIYDLIDTLFREEIERILAESLAYDSWQDAFLNVTKFIQSNKQALYHLYHSTNRSLVETYFYDAALIGMTRYVEKDAEALELGKEDVRVAAIFVTSAIFGLMMRWLQNGMKEDIHDYIVHIGRILDTIIRKAAEDYRAEA
ncbi:MAG: TetR/AcrR family transcriptional regulator [Ndongobacter sp.]|nr:TetR/AcrR family transcriptional regulator [Ndongobacter sp.]